MGPETESPSRGDQNRPLNLGNIVTRRRRSSVEELFYKESWRIVSVEAVCRYMKRGYLLRIWYHVACVTYQGG
jgi:hypothetical protein